VGGVAGAAREVAGVQTPNGLDVSLASQHNRALTMHAFDFILVLFSFVYAAAVTHVLSTAGEIIIASKRIRLSWFMEEKAEN